MTPDPRQPDPSSGPAPGLDVDPDIWSTDPADAGPRRPPRRSPGRARADGPRRPRREAAPIAEGEPPVPPMAQGGVRDTGRTRIVEVEAPVDAHGGAGGHDDDGEWEYLPDHGRFPRWLVGLVAIVAVLGLLAGGGWWWYQGKVDPRGGPGEATTVVIPEGSTVSGVAGILEDEGVITSATLFNFTVGDEDLTTIQAGTYEFRKNSSFDEAVAVLNAGPDQPATVETDKVNIPEGYTVAQIVAQLAEKVPQFSAEDLQAALDSGAVASSLQPDGNASYEGLLFPATYEVTDDDTAETFLAKMAGEMETRTQQFDIEAAAQRISTQWGIQVDPYDLLVVASLVQEEAGSPEEAPKVATVIYNRLREGTPLGIDATSRYLAELEGGEVDFDSASPFNTRKQAGLPPTPIATPGEYALDAALNPAEGNWIYYVLVEPGVHSFTDSYEQFQADKQLCIERDLGCG